MLAAADAISDIWHDSRDAQHNTLHAGMQAKCDEDAQRVGWTFEAPRKTAVLAVAHFYGSNGAGT